MISQSYGRDTVRNGKIMPPMPRLEFSRGRFERGVRIMLVNDLIQ